MGSLGSPKELPKDSRVLSSTMENTVLMLPPTKDGLLGLGDLWDCRANKTAGNLFQKRLGKKYLESKPIQSLHYSLSRAKNARDFVSAMHLSVSLSIEAAGGNVVIKGKAKFDKDERQKFHQERLLCNYDLTTFEVRLLEAALDPEDPDNDVLSSKVIDLLREKKLEATHYVHSVILGGQAQASITYYEDTDYSHFNLMGSLEGKITFGPVTASAKASVEILDTEFNEKINTEINITAQPRLNSAPTDCEAMFKEVEKIDNVILKENHFPELTIEGNLPIEERTIYGVPMKFRLVPLSRIILKDKRGPGRFDSEGTFPVMNPELEEAFMEMLLTLEDFSSEEFMKGLLWHELPQVVPILQDDFHPRTMELMDYARTISQKAIALKSSSMETFSRFKYGEADINEMESLVLKYNDDIPLIEINAWIQDLGRRCRLELAAIRNIDVDNLVNSTGSPSIKFLLNSSALSSWYDTEASIKLLLETANQGNTNGVFQKLYEMSGSLSDKGIEVGVAFPSISQNFSLRIKTIGREVILSEDEILFAVDIFALSAGVSTGRIFSLFFNINFQLNALSVPLEGKLLDDFPLALNIARSHLPNGGNISICETYCELLAQLGTSMDDSLNLVCPIEAVNRAMDIMRAHKFLDIALIKSGIPCHWYFSKINVKGKSSSPLLFVFRGSTLISICYDNADIAILLHCLQELPGNDWSPIAFATGRINSLYIQQWNYSSDVIPQCVLEHNSFLGDPLDHHDEFPKNSNDHLEESLTVIRHLAIGDDSQVFTTVALKALKIFKLELEQLLIEYCGWKENQVGAKNLKDLEWQPFADKARALLYTSAPHLIMVFSTIGALKGMLGPVPEIPEKPEIPDVAADPDPENEKLQDQIDRMISFLNALGVDPRLVPLREAVKKYDRTQEKYGNWGIRKDYIVHEFETFLIQSSNDEKFFHLYQLGELAEQMLNFGSISLYPIPLARVYCNRVNISEEEYPLVRVLIDEYLNQKALFKVLNLLDNITVHPVLFYLHREFHQIASLPAPSSCKSIVEKLKNFNLSEPQLKIIWGNPKFQHLIKTSVGNKGLEETIFRFAQSEMVKNKLESLPSYIPQQVGWSILPLFSQVISSGPEFPWAKVWEDDWRIFIEQLKIFIARTQVPDVFQTIFSNNLGSNLEAVLSNKNALFHWDKTNRIFRNNWTLLGVREAMYRLTDLWIPESKATLSLISEPISMPKIEDEFMQVIDSWKHFAKDGKLKCYNYGNFFLIQKIKPKPRKLTEDRIGFFCETFLPHILVHLRCNVSIASTQTFISSLVGYRDPEDREFKINFKIKKESKIISMASPLIFTNADLLIALAHSLDPIVLHELLQSFVQNHKTVPLIVPYIKQDLSYQFIWLKNSLETLILNNGSPFFLPPYRFVLALGCGSTGKEANRGALINRYLMKNNDCFNFIDSALNRSGFLELIHFNENSCKGPEIWNEIGNNYENENLFLGVLHGDALDLDPELFDIIKPFVSCMIVFWKVKDWHDLKAKKTMLEERLQHKCLDVVLYPDATIVSKIKDENILRLVPFAEANPGSIDRINSFKLRKIMVEAYEFTAADSRDNKQIVMSSKILEPTPALTKESVEFLNVVKFNGINKVKSSLCDFAKTPEDVHFVAQDAIDAFMKCFMLPKNSRDLSLHHIIFEVGKMSEAASILARIKIGKLRQEIDKSSSELQELHTQLMTQIENLNLNSLSLSNMIYCSGLTIENTPISHSFYANLADTIVTGFPVNLEDLFQENFKDSLSLTIDFLPEEDTRVFVVSIMGLKATGKSTLLNRLYAGCQGFSEYSGSEGISMKLFHVHEALRNELEVDAFLILDSEGISPPETIVDPASRHKEKNIITFLFAMCDLVIVNFSNSEFGKNLEFIQSAFLQLITMKELKDEKSIISFADMMLISQLRDQEQTTEIEGETHTRIAEQLCQTIKTVAELAKDKAVELGEKANDTVKLAQIYRHAFSSTPVHEIPPLNDQGHNSQNYFQQIHKLRDSIQSHCITSKSNRQGRMTLKNWLLSGKEMWSKLQELPLMDGIKKSDLEIAAYNDPENEQRIHANTLKSKLAIAKAIRVHEERLRELHAPRIREIFEGKFTPGFDINLKMVLDDISQDLLKVPNICEAKSSASKNNKYRTRMKIRTAEVNQDSCEECREAFVLKEQLFLSASGHFEASSPLVDDIQLFCDRLRYQTYNRFAGEILALNIQKRKSESLADFVENMSETGTKGYQAFLRYLSSLQFFQSGTEQFQEEFELVHRNLQEQIVAQNDPFSVVRSVRDIWNDLQSMAIFTPNSFYSESTFIPVQHTSSGMILSFKFATWLKIQLKNLPYSIVKEFKPVGFTKISILFKWGMASTLKTRVDEVLELLAFKINLKDTFYQFRLEFIWIVHVLAAKFFNEFLQLRENEYREDKDAIRLMFKEEEEFAKNPKGFFEPYDDGYDDNDGNSEVTVTAMMQKKI